MTPRGSLLRGVAFYAVIYPLMGLTGLLAFPAALASPAAARWVSKTYFRMVFACLRVIGAIRVEVRGAVPTGDVMVASKHQSMLDVFMLYEALPLARFVMKRELTRAPVFGWYAMRVGTVAIDRGAGAQAKAQMVEEMKTLAQGGDQIVIYPQGTRTPPGETRAYKAGVHALYEASGRPCVPAAVNTGVHWPKGLRLRPGVAAVQFLDPIPPGLDRDAFMARLEGVIEAASEALAAESLRG